MLTFRTCSTFFIVVLSLYMTPIRAFLPETPQVRNQNIPFRKILSNGLTFESCHSSSHCKPPRTCLQDNLKKECDGGLRCGCAPPTFLVCSTNADCHTGEVCVYHPFNLQFMCISKAFVTAISTIYSEYGYKWPNAPLQIDSKGLSFDPCRFSNDCIPPRLCMMFNAQNTCREGSNCRCIRSIVGKCSSDKDCPFGEACARTPLSPFSCVSKQFINASNTIHSAPFFTKHGDALVTDSCFSKGNKSVQEIQLHRENIPRVTFSKCLRSSDCFSSRACIGFTATTKPICCNGDSAINCRCIPPHFQICSRNSDCADGETCPNISSVTRFCMSPDALSTVIIGNLFGGKEPETAQEDDGQTQGSSEPTQENVCIGVHSLKQLSFRELTFEKHRMAKVLCDNNNSCATHGHMVWFHNKPMMMRSYCDVVGCREKVMLVNSPRRKVGLRMKSETDGMQFSAFAARYGTGTEEGILGIVMRVGL